MGIVPFLPGGITLHSILQVKRERETGRIIFRSRITPHGRTQAYSTAKYGTSRRLLFKTAGAQEEPRHRLPLAPKMDLPFCRFVLF